ncbi:hypothetical protein [Sphingomonas sp. UNC305MFCol5.2]|uniref:hypothetical protein n=1 Tax=Sphingomonas sp. UNC305MFCol5.2 TaxID=1449076 RepID=UPI0012DD245B|nr:hypothetical protein [Sphingomonas sp. UNC305MFCol5.2]
MAEPQSRNADTGCIVVVGVIGLVAMVAMCSAPKEDKTAQSFASPSLTNQIETMATPTPAPVAPLSAASIQMASRHLAAVARTEGLSGAMVYSQNCYDALTRAFSWRKLDQCGGFDMLAAGTIETADTEGLDAEVAYFEPEAAAGRYLAVAIKAGDEASDADERLEALKRRSAALARRASGATPSAEIEAVPHRDTDTPIENAVQDETDA